jgi:hypothetical protein
VIRQEEIMTAATSLNIAVPEDVMTEVRRKNAQVEFNAFRETVVDHFPDAVAIELRLLADPDEDDRSWIVFDVTLPALGRPEALQQRRAAFFPNLHLRRPHIPSPICTLHLWNAER